MSALTWHQRLSAAKSEDDVTAVVRDFMASVDSAALANLPVDCKPGMLLHAQDISSCAYDLLRYEYKGDDRAVEETIRHLAAFFSQAANRLSQITAPGRNGPRKLFG
jgi:hypothetical protein